MGLILFDTTVIVDLEREINRRQPGAVHAVLQSLRSESPAISVISFGEFAEGMQKHDRAGLLEYFRLYTIIPVDSGIAWRYGSLSRDGRVAGNRIGDNDLWIAATAIERTIPLLTRNTEHFDRISGLEVRTY
jgi:predicted nucleic acid-binding protein